MFLGALLLGIQCCITVADKYRIRRYYKSGTGVEYFCCWFSCDDTCRNGPAAGLYDQYWCSYSLVVAGVL